MTDHIRPDLNEDGLYYKYRVFKEPERDSQGNPLPEHPIPLDPPLWEANYLDRDGNVVHLVEELEEVTDFIFPLKPDTDHHARVALAAYAASVTEEKPLLARDLFAVLRDLLSHLEAEEQTP